jgi:VWFA-related protein
MATIARILLALLVTLLASGVSLAQTADAGARLSILRVDTSQPQWRDVYVSVADSRGLPVTGLDRNAFNLTEDGNSVPIERVSVSSDSQVPIAFGLVMDVSGSMNDAGKLDSAKQAASQLVASLGPADTAAVISFGDKAEVVQAMTSDQDALQAAIASLHAGGNTALYDAIVKTTLLTQALPQSFKVQLIVTDGTDTASSAHLSDVLNGLGAGGGVVYAVGIGSDVDRSVLDQVAQAGNGEALYTDDPSQLGSTFQSILDRLRLSYVLRYRAPTAPSPGQTHSVSASVTYQGQTAQMATSFMPPVDTVAVDVGGVTPGETFTGDRQVRATVRSGTAQRLDLLVDGTTAASSSGQPSSVVGELTRLSPGNHDLVVRVADSAGNQTVQHVPFTVAAPATPVPAATPAPTVQPVAAEQPVQAEEAPFWWLWAFVLLVLGIGLAYLGWLVRTTRPVAGAAAAQADADDATLDLEAPDDGLLGPQDQPLLRIESQGQERELTLGPLPVSIGRDADNTLVLRDAHVSRHHATVSLQDGQYWIEDLKSQNGTLLNGQVPIDRRQLEPGDQFVIGSATITYLAAAAAAPASADETEAAAPPPVAVGANGR